MAVKLAGEEGRYLGAFSVWAIGVGLVISGESFGWNLGWAIVGPVGFFVPVVLMGLMYYALVRCKIELACVYPEADGPHIYVKNAFGKHAGDFIALAILIEFVFVVPSIANAIGEYLGFLNNNPALANWIATLFVGIFCALSLFQLNVGIYLVIALTILAIFELFIYSGAVATGFNINNLFNTQYDKYDLESLVRAIPYAIWMYLAIEGVSLSAKNIKAKGFRQHISKGYQTAFWTLTALIFMVLLLAGGGVAWSAETWGYMTSDSHPLPASMALVLTKDHALVRVFTFLGLFGLMASLQGAATASATQLEMVMKMIYPPIKHTRILAPLLVFVISILAIWGGSTALLIELSVFGGVCMYFWVSLSLIRLRSKAQQQKHARYEGTSTDERIAYRHADFHATNATIFAVLAVGLSLFAIGACIYLHPFIFLFFVGIGAIYLLLGNYIRG